MTTGCTSPSWRPALLPTSGWGCLVSCRGFTHLDMRGGGIARRPRSMPSLPSGGIQYRCVVVSQCIINQTIELSGVRGMAKRLYDQTGQNVLR